MAIEIVMPQLSDTMHEGTILGWRKQEGDVVKRGDALAEVATDKADLEIESFHEGTLVKILAPQGTTVKVGSIIAMIGDKGEQVSAPQASQPASQPAASPVQPAPAQAAPVQPAPSQQAAVVPQSAPAAPAMTPPMTHTNGSAAVAHEERVKISPLAKNIAKNQGVDYANVVGTGDGGRIVKRDIEQAAGRGAVSQPSPQTSQPAPQASQPVQQARAPQPQTAPSFAGGKSTEPLSKMRQTIASRMVEATTTIPHFFATSRIEVDQLTKLKNSLKPLPQYEGLTYNHLILKAAAMTLRTVPRINAAYHEANLIQPQAVNIGIVTAVQDGLLIPVLKNADQLPLADIVAEGRGLVQRARSGRPKPDDLVGGTFSISNMGMFEVESFTAIISPGQGAILAVSPIQQEPVVSNGSIRVGSVMRLTLSVDHRIIDGVVAGEFLTEIKRLLEDPVLLLA